MVSIMPHAYNLYKHSIAGEIIIGDHAEVVVKLDTGKLSLPRIKLDIGDTSSSNNYI